MNIPSIQTDPVITKLLDKVPADMRGSFSDAQLLALKVALGGRAWGAHAVDARWTLKWWRWQYYFVFLAGRNKRVLSLRERKLQRLSMAIVLAVFLLVSTAVGLLVLYLVKSALGIDLIPGFSLGVWGWFQSEFLR
ncbi:3-phosphoshikimate 1-carboxyvinyltransferase [Rhodoferax aquaticus]|uniref:3-phosphoshikimate 1-carboxyvinyltransferase n=1 Tax=Rhodoferax aquaticus TaxID=2527691 RepID=A0A515EK22_9BURK|nr:3-phosphoshikimate 1-carboxyvinyltransferase [Rhodoferax aquaticus]QDL53011.1 3-phosphoshikimate 1-carboxyvinyltransferase [Rhodoferax aquaticus]